MKKFVTLLLVAILSTTVLAGCGTGNGSGNSGLTQTERDIVGVWEYEGGGYIYEFKADGTGTYTIIDSVLTFTYTIEGNVVTLVYEDDVPLEVEFELNGDSLTMKDSFGNDIIYNRQSKD